MTVGSTTGSVGWDHDTDRDTRTGPLVDYRVLDLAVLFAGPLIGAQLADFGADVVKVERPEGDPTREFGRRIGNSGLFWKYTGRNKRTIVADLRSEESQRLVKDLAAKADVVIESFKPGVMESWGLGWETLHEINPRLVMVRVSGFGQTGPYRERGGFGSVIDGMCGFASINGHPDGPPTMSPFALGDSIASMTGTAAVLLALLWRERSGEGQWIDVSLLEPFFNMLAPRAMLQPYEDASGRWGNRSPEVAPRNAYRCADGKWICLSGASQETCRRVFEAIGRPELFLDERFSTNRARVVHADEMDEAIQEWASRHDRPTVLAAFEDAGAVVGPIYEFEDLLADPHFIFRQMFVPVADTSADEDVYLPNVAARLSKTPGRIRHAGRELDQDRESILKEWLG